MSTHPTATLYRLFVSITPGLEPLLAQELTDLGIGAKQTSVTGGMELMGDRQCLWRLCRDSRLAESVRVRLGPPFAARSFDDLLAGLGRLPWAAYLQRGGALPEVRVTCHHSRLYHSGAVAQRVVQVLTDRVGCQDQGGDAADRVHVRLERDQVQVSVDASGELLHRRGYRLHVGQAPLRETLAAACLRAAAYTHTSHLAHPSPPVGHQRSAPHSGEAPPLRALWDPFCGAGTLVLEALAMAAGIAPGAQRRFAFERWPTHDARAYADWLAESPVPDAVPPSLRLFASDRDPRELEAARANARAAELETHLTLSEGDFQQVAPQIPAGTGIITNPPYGKRLPGEPDLYPRLGELLRQRPDLRPVHLLTAVRGLGRLTDCKWEAVLSFSNRGLPVRLLRLTD